MPEEKTLSNFDRLAGQLDGLPDVVSSKPATLITMEPLTGISETFIVRTVRQWGKGDTIFLQSISAEGSMRIAIPPDVSDAIARQREALATKSRRKISKAAAADRKQKGIQPAFLRNPGRRKKKGGDSK